MKGLFIDLVQTARQRELPFLIVGGHAVILLGAPRFTRDIDILITDEHRDAWSRLLEKKGYRLFHRVDAFDQFEPIVNKGAETPGIDFMLVDAGTWDKLIASAREVELLPGVQVPVPDPLHLIAMKLAAANSPRRRQDAQDFSDVGHLIKKWKINIDDPVVCETIVKYGGNQSLQRLKNLL